MMNQRPRTTKWCGWHMQGFFPWFLYSKATELQHLMHYLDHVSVFIQEEAKHFRLDLERVITEKGLSKEEVNQFHEEHEGEHSKYRFFPIALRYSVMMSACSLFEAALTEACKRLESDKKILICSTWKNYKHPRGIQRAKKFLKDNFDICLGSHPKWSKIMDILKIRNCIAHANGDISIMNNKDQEDVRKSIKRLVTDGIFESPTKMVLFDILFVKRSMEHMKKFWTDLIKAFSENEVVGPVFWP